MCVYEEETRKQGKQPATLFIQSSKTKTKNSNRKLKDSFVFRAQSCVPLSDLSNT